MVENFNSASLADEKHEGTNLAKTLEAKPSEYKGIDYSPEIESPDVFRQIKPLKCEEG